MPVILVERLPLPSLRAYTAVSILLLAGSIYYAIQVTQGGSGFGKTGHVGQVHPQDISIIGRLLGGTRIAQLQDNVNSTTGNKSRTSFAHQMADLVTFMIQEPHCIWVSIINYSITSFSFRIGTRLAMLLSCVILHKSCPIITFYAKTM